MAKSKGFPMGIRISIVLLVLIGLGVGGYFFLMFTDFGTTLLLKGKNIPECVADVDCFGKNICSEDICIAPEIIDGELIVNPLSITPPDSLTDTIEIYRFKLVNLLSEDIIRVNVLLPEGFSSPSCSPQDGNGWITQSSTNFCEFTTGLASFRKFGSEDLGSNPIRPDDSFNFLVSTKNPINVGKYIWFVKVEDTTGTILEYDATTIIEEGIKPLGGFIKSSDGKFEVQVSPFIFNVDSQNLPIDVSVTVRNIGGDSAIKIHLQAPGAWEDEKCFEVIGWDLLTTSTGICIYTAQIGNELLPTREIKLGFNSRVRRGYSSDDMSIKIPIFKTTRSATSVDYPIQVNDLDECIALDGFCTRPENDRSCPEDCLF